MTIEATIIVPTHNHGATLARSVRSALCQTVCDVEVVILGDGVTEATFATATELARSDPRVRFYANPKHESRGEPHRDRAVRESRANVICYLSDDDLYLPDHVETVIGLLREADFVHAVPVHVDGNGALATRTIDLSIPEHRHWIAKEGNRIPLSTGAHLRSAYENLQHGWRTPPPLVPSDLFMWRQFLASEGCRFASPTKPTVVVFPSPMRLGWTLEQRVDELDLWCGRLASPEGYRAFLDDLLVLKVREASELDSERLHFHRTLAGSIATVAGARATSADPLAAVGELLEQLDRALATVSRERDVLKHARDALQHERDVLEESLAERTAALAAAQGQLALVSRRPEAAALRFVAQLRRVRRAVLRRAS